VLRPVVILPAGWRKWNANTRRAVLAHEFAHLRRRHPLISALARFAKCEFWFHLLAWWSAAEFLYACVRRTVEQDLPQEIEYIRRHDEATRRIMDAVEMPDRLAGNLVMSIRQNNGILSKKRREGEFHQLRADEVTLIEAIVRDAFEGF